MDKNEVADLINSILQQKIFEFLKENLTLNITTDRWYDSNTKSIDIEVCLVNPEINQSEVVARDSFSVDEGD